MIIYKYTETSELYVYTLRSRLVFIVSVILIVGTLFYGLKYYPYSHAYLYGWLFLIAIFFIDSFPMGFRQWIAKVKGKSIKKSGNLFVGNVSVEIQK